MERRSIAGARRRAKVSADATHQAALAYRDGLMEEAEAAERKRLAAERAANPSRCKCGHVRDDGRADVGSPSRASRR